jgi:outer membrane protein
MKIQLAALLFTAAAPTLSAQAKIAHFNSEAVMKQLPDAQDAQRQLDQLTTDWQSELNRLQGDWKKKFDEYDKRKLIMTDQRRAEAEKDLRDLDQKIVDFRTQKFGQNGELFQKQNELMKPVQDRVFNAVQEIAKEDGYDYVFDKTGEILLMYANNKFDITEKILTRLKSPLIPKPPGQ